MKRILNPLLVGASVRRLWHHLTGQSSPGQPTTPRLPRGPHKLLITLAILGFTCKAGYSANNPCVYGAYTVQTAPILSISASNPGNKCINNSVSVTATTATTTGTKVHSDNCGHTQTATLSLSTPTVSCTVSGVTATTPSLSVSGSTVTATFTPQSSGICTVTFTATATTTDPAGTYTATTTVTFSVFEVVSLKPEQGFPLANTTTYQLCQKQNAVVKVNAVANPPVATDAALPSSGWDLVNVSTHSVQSSTTVSLSQVATYTVSCTDGTSTKSITISVVAPPTPPGLDTDYDGICDCQEMLDGTDPTSASSMGSVGLSFFTFNQSSLSGAQSQTPRTETLNTRTVTGKVDTAVQIDSQSTAILAYDESNYNNNGRLNINLQQGTVRFYFKPDWLSSISNGTGPGQGNSADSRLVEVGSNTGGNSDQWWAITISPDGNQLSLKTRNGATTTLAVSAPIAWAANEWHQVCLTYSSAGSAIYIDGVAKTTGAAVASVPSSTVRTNGFRIGSDASGNNQARGIVDQFEVFNTVLSSADIFAAFTASQNASQPLNSCNLYPIAFPQATYTANQIVVVTLQNSLPGNFGWLHWNGNDSSMTPSDLATSLTAPGNSSTYQNPKVFGDTVINVGDKIKGDTGVERAKAVINALNGLVGQTIDLPVCTYDNLGNDKGLYTVAGYAHVLFQSYNFNGSQKTMTFKYLQAQSCELTPQCQVPTLTAVNTLSGAIEDTPFDIPFDSLAAAATTADVDGPLPTLFKLVNVTSGSLAVRLDTTHTQTVNPGDVFDAGQTWVWTPAANANGTLNAFTIKAWDRCVASATAVQVSISVTPVNDCPTLDILNSLTINEDAAAQAVNLTGIGPGPNESGQVLTVTASSSNPGLIPNPTVTYTSPNPTGTLNFTPVANQFGSATITVTVQDDGGTANGGCNTISRTFTVTVNPVNDPPIVDAGQNLSIYSSLSVDLTGTFQDPDGDPPRNIIWSVVSGPPNIVPISYSPNASSLATRATVPTPGIYLFALQASDAQFTASDTVTISFYPDTAPIVDAGPDQRIPRNSTAHLRGSTSIGSLPPGSTVVTTWTTLSGASISQDPNNKLNATSSLSVAGIYTFTLTVTKQWTDAGGNPHLLSGSDDVLVTVADACSRKYTRNADFAEGTLVNVNYTNVPGQLHLNSSISPFSFVNVPCPGRGTVVRIDANTGHILGEYWTAPNGRNREGFRVAVDRLGNTWVANYSEDTLSGGINMGSIMEIGVVIGGTRTDGTKDGLGRYVYRSDGQYLAPPFAYNTCKDRNGDGLIKTSMGLGNKLDWNLNSAGSDIDGASLADDECILRYIRVAPWHIGTLALDKNNNVWTGGYGQSAVSDLSLQKLNVNVDPPTLEAAITTINCGGYYGFIDSHGVLWSTLLGSGVLRWDLSLPATDAQCFLSDDLGNWLGLARFVAPDPNTGQIWGTFSNDPGVVKANPDGMPSGATYLFDDGYYWAQGLVVDGNHNVWVAHGAERGTTVGHLTTGGDFIGNVELPCGKGTGYPALDLPIDGYDSAPNIFSGAGPQIISVGSDGKIWVVNVNRNNAMRIDPAAGPLGGMRQDTRVGAVDQVVDLGQQAFFVPEQAQLYNFIAGDMTGFITVGSTAPSGSWTVVHDSKNSGQTWGRVSWTGVEDVASGATISVEVRAADLQLGLTTKSFSAVANGTDFNAMGQFIEIRVTLSKGAGSVQPILTDLTVSCGGPPPAFPADTTPSIAQDDSKVVLRDTADNLIDVLANDLTKSDPAWLIASVSPAHSGVVLNNLTNLSYTPSPGFFGRDAFSYTIDNGNNSPSRALVNIEVLRPSAAEPITTRDDMFTISANSGHISLDLR